MNVIVARRVLTGAVLGLMLGAAVPAFAQHGGGGHGGGGPVGGAGHFSGGGAHFGGGARAGGGHFSGAAHISSFSGGHAGGYGGTVGARGSIAAYHGAVATAAGYHVADRGNYAYPGSYHYGYSTGAHWHGGYWRGGFWPGAYYGPGFAWFLPILPAVYATYWWGGIPYFFANDVYYTWNPAYDGYVAADPPPVAEQGVPAAAPAASAQLFMYPKNGQSEAQQSTDRRECQQWAASQAGAGGENAADYRRAMVACVEGRGYSAN